ncbi:hypothetical protein GCM10010517_08450 [Streptosporangium fragile]|uniref:Uncharacterized protein n=1 Tax=Streptosporangium fragile TaxID=46186 RepID=A0ABN3VR09_9ACTN
MTAYGDGMAVSNVPQGSVNSVDFGTGTAADPEGDATGELPLLGVLSPIGTTSTTAATAAMIATPRKAMSQRTFRTLPFL